MLLHKQNTLLSAQNLFREFYLIDLAQNSRNKILHHIDPQIIVIQLMTNFKKTPLKLQDTTILCTNYILTFPSNEIFNKNIIAEIQSVQMTSFYSQSSSNGTHPNLQKIQPPINPAVTTNIHLADPSSTHSSAIQRTHPNDNSEDNSIIFEQKQRNIVLDYE